MAFMDVLTHSSILRRRAAGNPPAEIETFLQEIEQAEDYLKQALEEGDLELLKLTIENLIQAGYGSFKIEPIELLENTNLQLQRQKPAAQIEIIEGQKPTT